MPRPLEETHHYKFDIKKKKIKLLLKKEKILPKASDQYCCSSNSNILALIFSIFLCDPK